MRGPRRGTCSHVQHQRQRPASIGRQGDAVERPACLCVQAVRSEAAELRQALTQARTASEEAAAEQEQLQEQLQAAKTTGASQSARLAQLQAGAPTTGLNCSALHSCCDGTVTWRHEQHTTQQG